MSQRNQPKRMSDMSKFKHKYILCPICQKHKFPEPGDRFDMCPYCGWVHDDVSEDEECRNIAIGPNNKSFIEHKARYLQTIKDNPDFYYNRDGYPEEDEE